MLLIALAATFCLVTLVAFWRGQRRAGRTFLASLGAARWRTALAMPIIGVIGGVLLAGGLAWNYPVALRAFGGWALGKGIDLPLIAWAGPIAFVIGGVTGARLGGRASLRYPELWQSLRCLAGGAIMGVAGFLVPGGNDVLLLAGLPSLSVHAVAAYITVLATLVVIACAILRLRHG